mgnify:CR=1 FL=1
MFNTPLTTSGISILLKIPVFSADTKLTNKTANTKREDIFYIFFYLF